MAFTEKKTLMELIALYELEPELRDIYVEGVRDKDIVEWFLRKHERTDISVYTIDIVDVPDDTIRGYGLPIHSCRSRVIVLSYKLQQAQKIRGKVLCVADRDYEDFIQTTHKNPFLTFTDYNSIESYLLEPGVIAKFTKVVLGNIPTDYELFITQVKLVLRNLFFIRLTNESLRWGMEWLMPLRSLNVSRDSITFDVAKFIQAYLLKNGRLRSEEIFLSKFAELKQTFAEDDRFVIRGHDLVDLLHHVIRRLKSHRNFGDSDFFGGAFMGCLEARDLSSYSLFHNILSM